MLTKVIFVDGGKFSTPFYNFYYDAQGTQPIEILSFDIFTSYNFFRLNNVGSHPFYIKDNSGSNDGLNFTGNGSNTSGIKNEENFLLSFDTDIDLTAPISYFCTSHASMNFEVEITALEKIANIENNSIVSNLEIGKNYTLSSIRDFDGNFHAKKGITSDVVKVAYKYQGLFDVNSDGTKEAIYTNKESGRWVTAAVDNSTGEIDYGDHGENGTTRIVGIYIDPLVTSGEVEQFGPYDSQRRFQNDLKIDNLIAKTSGDYDGDGFQEVYWKTNDGTAYLRALMHADGNIQYANYQSKEQMSDYLTSKGFESEISSII
jgi:hypothetical protein